MGLQLAPRNASELQPVFMNTVFILFATPPIARPEAEEISPMIIATLSRSMRRSASRKLSGDSTGSPLQAQFSGP